ncbi:MAG: EAL domain-containing protein, partial [Gammaproteobacteria bacterium]|nr:EAL domain-containing protein [Gammaproteobacteria bacterium]
GQKILGLAGLTTGVAVVLVCAALFYVEYTQAERRVVRELETTAQLIATHSRAAIIFDDPTTGFETLNALQAVEEIQSACIFDPSGGSFACYASEGESMPVSSRMVNGTRIEDGVLYLTRNIHYDGSLLGSLVIHYDMSSVSERLTSRARVAATVGAFAMALSLLLAAMLRRRLTLPVNELLRTTQLASAEDYSVRARRFANDELGMLTDAINHMLNQIEERDIELGRSNELVGALRESRSRLAVAQRMAGLGYWTWNTETNELTISEELASICDIDDDEPKKLAQFADLIDEQDRDSFDRDLARVLKERVPVDANYRLRTGSGRLLHVHQQLNVEHVDDEPAVVVATVQDVTAQKTAEEQIRRLAYFDSLTGLASRSYLYKRLDEMIRSARRRQEGFALFFMDLDGFKDVNDSLGHDEGDTLLKTIAERLTDTLRENDFLARLGGDEFCMLLEDVSDEMIIGQIAARCLESVEAKVDLGASIVRPQVSIGISRFPEDGGDTHALLRAADSAMYAAKESGRHCFEFFDRDMTQRAGQRLALAQELRGALQAGQFELYYQPQINLTTGLAVGFEALVRWNHPIRGLVPPNDFIPELERMGLINELGDWAVLTACRQIVQWRLDGMKDPHVSVNIAPSHFQSTDLIEAVKEALLLTGIAPECLELEITETGVQYSEETLVVFEELKQMGVRIAIDDFGSGYSSLGSLQHLPIDCLKIDRVFISDLLNNPKDAVLLGTIMSMAHALDFHVVAEGVEELEQVHILRALDCDVVQGFYFSRPVPASEIPELSLHSFFPEDLSIVQLNAAKIN